MLNRLIRNLILFLIVLVVIATIVITLLPTNQDHYMFALKDKHERLASISSPKIVIIGGSNTAFGVDSKLIQNRLNRPVANMGLHLDLRINYMINEVKPFLKEGDMVILIPEYSHLFRSPTSGNTKAFHKAVEVYPSAIKYLDLREQLRYSLNTYVSILQSKLNSILLNGGIVESEIVENNKNVYRRSSYDELGDMIAHLNRSSIGFDKNDDNFNNLKGKNINPEFCETINSFKKFADEKAISFLISFPPTPQSMFNEDVSKEIYTEFDENIKVPLINTPEDFVYGDSLFFDTRYHLVSSSRESRTLKLISSIQRNLSLND
ncbi:hypothetical protein QQ008_17170 [Fulvivirgaceae bacterium BMA10]|uniref:SGNH/GDSL hydrolase family protein n=1 Tax=Splendidivirga corallicola TaxID=3051826 RepID=A0ABT8KQV2_9BACT|nr:hypothetical protein [Fulvivirgaceae bacterium BMA10]